VTTFSIDFEEKHHGDTCQEVSREITEAQWVQVAGRARRVSQVPQKKHEGSIDEARQIGEEESREEIDQARCG
jgi:hypothetical protein